MTINHSTDIPEQNKEPQKRTRVPEAVSGLADSVREKLMLLWVSVALASAPVGVKVAEAQGTKAHPYAIADYSIPDIKFDSVGLGEEQFDGLPNKKEDTAALQRFLWVEPASGNMWPKTKKAIVDYKTRMGLGATPEVDEATYKKIAEDMIRLRMDFAMETMNDKPVAKFAIAYLLSKSLWIRVEGRYGKDIEQILGTVGLKVNQDLLLKWTIGYLLRGDNYRFDGVNEDIYKKIGQFVAWLEAKYSGFSKDSFVQEVGGGVVMFDVKGKKLWSLGNIMDGGDIVWERFWAITAWQRVQWFASTALRISSNMKVELVWGYFEARETNPMDVGSRKTQWLYGDVKWIYRIAPQLQVFGKVGGEKGRLTYGWGIDIATAWSGVLSGEYQREQIDARKPDNRFMLKFSIALWGPAHQKSAELPPLFDDKGQTIAPRDLPTDLSYVGAVNTVKTPREGLTFADLMPVQGTDITYITVWGNAVTQEKMKPIDKIPTAQNFVHDMGNTDGFSFSLLNYVNDTETPKNKLKIKIVWAPTTNQTFFLQTPPQFLTLWSEFSADKMLIVSCDQSVATFFSEVTFSYVVIDEKGNQSKIATVKIKNLKAN